MAETNKKRRESSYQQERHVTELLTKVARSPMSGNVYMNYNCQLTRWVGVNATEHVGKEDNQVKQHYYVTPFQTHPCLLYTSDAADE